MSEISKAVAEELRRLEKKSRDGILRPTFVFKNARDPQSPIHRYFTWNVEEAARKRNLDEARKLINYYKFKITVENCEVKIPVYVHHHVRLRGVEGYENIETIKKGPESDKKSLLLYDIKQIESAILQARAMAIYLGLEKYVNDLLRSICTFQKKLKTAVQK